jgi:MraZ protein
MVSFLGEYESTIDTKGRFLLPAAFKKQLPKDDEGHFVINRGLRNALPFILCKPGNPFLQT